MVKGLDYAWGKPGAKNIKEDGFRFVCRYLSRNMSKNIRASEVKDLHDNGIKIVLIWKTTELRPLAGFEAGKQDAAKAKELADDIGFPEDRPIYFACDYDFIEKEQPRLNEYFRGVATILPLERIGIYGGYYVVKRILNADLATYSWQSSAFSAYKKEPRIHIKQIKYNYKINGVDCEINESRKDDYGQW